MPSANPTYPLELYLPSAAVLGGAQKLHLHQPMGPPGKGLCDSGPSSSLQLRRFLSRCPPRLLRVSRVGYCCRCWDHSSE